MRIKAIITVWLTFFFKDGCAYATDSFVLVKVDLTSAYPLPEYDGDSWYYLDMPVEDLVLIEPDANIPNFDDAIKMHDSDHFMRSFNSVYMARIMDVFEIFKFPVMFCVDDTKMKMSWAAKDIYINAFLMGIRD